MTAIKSVFIDADTGIDDSLAIVYALQTNDIKVEGITTVFGNTDVEQATENTLRIIQLVNPGYEVPVALGAAKPLKRDWSGPVVQVHGENGIGNVKLPETSQQPLKESAAEFIVRKANEFEGQITLITLGRLTNIAEALSLDPTLSKKFQEVIVMGGSVFAPGNVMPRAEANFYGDPEAASCVIQSGMPITMVGLDVTMKARLTKKHLTELAQICAPSSKHLVDYIEETLRYYFNFHYKTENFIDQCPLHDPLTVLIVNNPDLVRTEIMKVNIECESSINPGAVIPDLRTNPTDGYEIKVCIDVDQEKAVKELLSVFI